MKNFFMAALAFFLPFLPGQSKAQDTVIILQDLPNASTSATTETDADTEAGGDETVETTAVPTDVELNGDGQVLGDLPDPQILTQVRLSDLIQQHVDAVLEERLQEALDETLEEPLEDVIAGEVAARLGLETAEGEDAVLDEESLAEENMTTDTATRSIVDDDDDEDLLTNDDAVQEAPEDLERADLQYNFQQVHNSLLQLQNRPVAEVFPSVIASYGPPDQVYFDEYNWTVPSTEEDGCIDFTIEIDDERLLVQDIDVEETPCQTPL